MRKSAEGGFSVGRRGLLKGAGALSVLGTAPLVGSTPLSAQPAGPFAENARIEAGAGQARVGTRSGVVEGYRLGGIFAFKGIPYAQTTAGQNRFAPPQPVTPWAGIRSSRSFGLVAPQDKGTGRLNDEEAFIFQWNDSVEGEDCLRVNVWTPGIDDGGKRPVMVWLHGGGFDAGSGNDLPAFDGHNLARRGDVVVVTLNHRLNLLGFLDLSAHGERYARSANAGMLDIVAALEWVRDNIANFGGDPGRVTIFGQSGGGAKVGTLMGMPAARGLFHRAIVQSGSFASARKPEQSRRLADLLIAELGIASADIAKIEEIPYLQLRRASEAVIARENRTAGGPFDVRALAARLGYGPVLNPVDLPASPFDPDAPAISAEVPMIVGTTLNEFATGINHPEYEAMAEPELLARVEAAYPGQGRAVVAAFRKRTPDLKPFDLWSRIASAPVRRAAIAQAAAKARLGAAPAFLYWFSRFPTVLDGRPRAFHCAEIPYVFANAERCASMTGGDPAAVALSDIMADAWIAFARSGDPNHAGMPEWLPVGAGRQPSMMFDDVTRLADAPDRDELAALG
jgi:para-nitrobenzyl esterase